MPICIVNSFLLERLLGSFGEWDQKFERPKPAALNFSFSSVQVLDAS
jgi:hypothetical protein